jgi:acetoin utilization deacetylase AcuC-like enzyme
MALEGGYNPDALAESVLSVLTSLLSTGEGRKREEQPSASEQVKRRVQEVKDVQRDYWDI